MGIITLISDWHKSDYYTGAVKGRILSHDASTVIVDINHQIAPFNIMQAAFVLKNCYKEYPDNTVHILGVNSLLTTKRALLIIEKEKQYFLCSDCGFPDLLFPGEDKKVFRRKVLPNEGNTFVSLNVFVDVAFQLIQGEKPDKIGELSTDYIQQKPLLPTIDTNLINGSVIYIDSYSNVITNINREIFDRVGKGHAFEIYVQSNHYKIQSISRSYHDLQTGELVALFNSAGLLEISLVYGPIAELLDLSINSVVRIKFSNEKNNDTLLLSGE